MYVFTQNDTYIAYRVCYRKQEMFTIREDFDSLPLLVFLTLINLQIAQL